MTDFELQQHHTKITNKFEITLEEHKNNYPLAFMEFMDAIEGLDINDEARVEILEEAYEFYLVNYELGDFLEYLECEKDKLHGSGLHDKLDFLVNDIRNLNLEGIEVYEIYTQIEDLYLSFKDLDIRKLKKPRVLDVLNYYTSNGSTNNLDEQIKLYI